MYFDDTYDHEAVNPNPQEERIVLWLDLKRHDFKGWRERLISNVVFWLLKKFPPSTITENILKMNQLCSASQLEA